MALVQFVHNYEDLSTDRGYQFRFRCDRCGNGHMSQFETSMVGTAGSVLRVASDLFGGWFNSVGHSSYEIQRAIGGPAHDKALQSAVAEGKRHFKQCSRCGKWVCPDVCWNHAAQQCEDCAPDFAEEFASAHAHAKAIAAKEQLHEKARATDYVAKVDMKAESVNSHAGATICGECAKPVAGKFCSDCGSAVVQSSGCRQCGTLLKPNARFCPECGSKAGGK